MMIALINIFGMNCLLPKPSQMQGEEEVLPRQDDDGYIGDAEHVLLAANVFVRKLFCEPAILLLYSMVDLSLALSVLIMIIVSPE